jgi:hypothetical protein
MTTYDNIDQSKTDDTHQNNLNYTLCNNKLFMLCDSCLWSASCINGKTTIYILDVHNALKP